MGCNGITWLAVGAQYLACCWSSVLEDLGWLVDLREDDERMCRRGLSEDDAGTVAGGWEAVELDSDWMVSNRGSSIGCSPSPSKPERPCQRTLGRRDAAARHQSEALPAGKRVGRAVVVRY